MLCEKYKLYAWAVAKAYFDELYNTDVILEDLMSIAFSVVLTALKKKTDNSTFYAYWLKIARNSMKKFVKDNTPEEIRCFNAVFSLDQYADDDLQLHEKITKSDDENIESIRTTILEIVNNPNNYFSFEEKCVVGLFLDGFDFNEIAEMLNMAKHKVYRLNRNAIDKIRLVYKKIK